MEQTSTHMDTQERSSHTYTPRQRHREYAQPTQREKRYSMAQHGTNTTDRDITRSRNELAARRLTWHRMHRRMCNRSHMVSRLDMHVEMSSIAYARCACVCANGSVSDLHASVYACVHTIAGHVCVTVCMCAATLVRSAHQRSCARNSDNVQLYLMRVCVCACVCLLCSHVSHVVYA